MKSVRTWTLASDMYLPDPVKGEARPERALSFTGRYQSREAAEAAGERIFSASGVEYRVVADLMRPKRESASRASRFADDD